MQAFQRSGNGIARPLQGRGAAVALARRRHRRVGQDIVDDALLPQPLGPTSAAAWPAAMPNSTWLGTVLASKRFL